MALPETGEVIGAGTVGSVFIVRGGRAVGGYFLGVDFSGQAVGLEALSRGADHALLVDAVRRGRLPAEPA